MELKKYILLKNNTIVKFYKNERFGFSYIEDEINGVILTRSLLISNVKKTSDNILDLVEPGDMLLRNDDCYYYIVVTDIDTDTFYGDNAEIWRGNRITYIWKCQENGDYKRYEVEAWK